MQLKILPRNIADMIAASSVVKELMENAVDAGADQISVTVTDAGRTLIQVIDNGCGMSPDDAVLCFERHATSKIATAEDLQEITTFGFRGEALASIAAVADVVLRTRREEDEVGVEVEISGSEHLSTREVAAPKGSNFAVRNLFYNIPARRKFLKSDTVEFRHIVEEFQRVALTRPEIEEFQRVALTRPEIGFTLTHNGRDVHVLKPAKSLKFRIMDLLGPGVVGEVVDIAADTSLVRVHGFVGRPESAKKTLGNQFLFVNGRYFRSAYLHKAVMKAYEALIPEGTTPSYFIFLEVDPSSIDVNIHPTKTPASARPRPAAAPAATSTLTIPRRGRCPSSAPASANTARSAFPRPAWTRTTTPSRLATSTWMTGTFVPSRSRASLSGRPIPSTSTKTTASSSRTAPCLRRRSWWSRGSTSSPSPPPA